MSPTYPEKYFVMIKNLGSMDRVLRVVIALIVGVLIVAGLLEGVWAIVLGILAAVFLLTGFVGTCPLYLPFHLSTRKS